MCIRDRNIIYDLAVSNEYEGVTGQYFDNDKGNPKGDFGPAHTNAYNVTAIDNLMQATKNLLNQ